MRISRLYVLVQLLAAIASVALPIVRCRSVQDKSHMPSLQTFMMQQFAVAHELNHAVDCHHVRAVTGRYICQSAEASVCLIMWHQDQQAARRGLTAK